MTPEAQLALINSLPTIIASIGTVVAGVVALKATQSKSEAKEVAGKLDHIAVTTNSTLTEAKDRITVLESLIRQMIAKSGNGPKAEAAQLPAEGPEA